MAKPPPKPPRKPSEDPRVTDLRRYRREREEAAKRKPKPNPKAQMRETFLGANPRAGLILAILAVVILAYLFLPALIALLRP
ncbi:hypothetical protein [uncultured Phenylobacterium sp.]|uniref:hypothetical protein n=1 Tax=uncultured Phenylobacterium sp. TaxID=349273 RepID=UPI0025EB6D0A|nr:hypothetical protein [uncultured Phenylobacterium sp.]